MTYLTSTYVRFMKGARQSFNLYV